MMPRVRRRHQGKPWSRPRPRSAVGVRTLRSRKNCAAPAGAAALTRTKKGTPLDNPPIDEKWYTAAEVGDIFKVADYTVRDWLRSGQLEGILIANKTGWRVSESALQAFIAKRQVEAAARRIARRRGRVPATPETTG